MLLNQIFSTRVAVPTMLRGVLISDAFLTNSIKALVHRNGVITLMGLPHTTVSNGGPSVRAASDAQSA